MTKTKTVSIILIELKSSRKMLTSTSIAFVVIFLLEATIIIIGNAFTIFVFATQVSHLKRTCFLLINLAVADLLVGISEPIVLATEKFHNIAAAGGGGTLQNQTNPWIAFQVLATSSSVLFLALISLERAYSVLWPIQHRVTNITAYIYSIIIVWAVGCCMLGLSLVPLYYTKVERKYVFVPFQSFLFIALVVICVSYLKIRNRWHNPVPELDIHSRPYTEHNVRLSRTIFIVTAVSLVFWVPAFIVYLTREFCPQCFSPTAVWLVNALHLANSMVNPFVYSFRMQIFKDALKKVVRKRRRNIEIRPIQENSLQVITPQRSFTPVMEQGVQTSCNELTCHGEIRTVKHH